MLTHVVVGSGYRAEYFGRIARTWPELFKACYLCRSVEKAALMRRNTGVEAVEDARFWLRLQDTVEAFAARL